MTTSQSPWEYMALAALVVVAAAWVNRGWALVLMFKVLDAILPRDATRLRERVRPGQVLQIILLVGVFVWIWTRYRTDFHALVVLVEVAGIALLAAEVWTGQEFETFDRKASQLESLMQMYLGKNYRGYWVLHRRYWDSKVVSYDTLLSEAPGLTDQDAEAYAKTTWTKLELDLEKLVKTGGVPAAVERWEKTTARTAVWRRQRLWAGVAMLIAAALLSLFEPKEEVPPPPPPVDDEIKVGLRLQGAHRLPSFVSGSAELTPDIKGAICRYRATPAEWESAVAIVVGRHDKTELSARTRTQFSSNASLAEQRGLAIQSALKNPLFCGPEQAFAGKVSVLQLDSPPRHAGSRVSSEHLAEDRGAELYLLTATSQRVPRGVESGR